MTMTFSLHSPKARAAGQHIAKHSVIRQYYANEDLGVLFSVTPEARPDPVLNFVPQAGYTGTFRLNTRAMFSALLGADGLHNNLIICTYAIIHRESGTAYVGSTENFMLRWRRHYQLLKAGGHKNKRLQEAFNQCGEDQFDMVIVQSYSTVQGLMDNEVKDSLKFKSLYNLRIGNQPVPDWHLHANWSKGKYEPKTKRGPQAKSRWFDGIGESKNAYKH